VGREENYRNPYGSIPSPSAKEIPVTYWATPPGLAVSWQGLVGGVDTATWTSPIFDLRPDLRSSQNQAKTGVPIWSSDARLYVQLFSLALTAATTEFLRMGYREFANTTFGLVTSPGPNRAVPASGFPNQIGRNPVVQVTPQIDITSEVMLGTNQPDSVVLVFETLGEGYPVRYWQLQIVWTNIGVAGSPINMQAAMY